MEKFLNKSPQYEHKKALGAYFSTQTETWTKYYTPDDSSGMLKLEVVKRKDTVLYFLDKFGRTESGYILDVGCGAGMLMKDMLARGHRVVGSDISAEMLEQTRKNTVDFLSSSKELILGDLEDLSFEDATFDFVTCVGVLEYQQDDRKSISEVSRVLKDGGIAIITLPNLLRLRNLLDPYYYFALFPKVLRKLYRKQKPDTLNIVEAFKHNKSMTNKRYYYGQRTRLFNSFGLEVLDCVSISFWPPTIWRRNLLPRERAIKFSNFIENWPKGRRLPLFNWLANRWVFCLQKRKV